MPPAPHRISICRSRAKRTAAMTSAEPLQRAITAGRLSIIPFQIRRAPS
jgi:hypothetical protein